MFLSLHLRDILLYCMWVEGWMQYVHQHITHALHFSSSDTSTYFLTKTTDSWFMIQSASGVTHSVTLHTCSAKKHWIKRFIKHLVYVPLNHLNLYIHTRAQHINWGSYTRPHASEITMWAHHSSDYLASGVPNKCFIGVPDENQKPYLNFRNSVVVGCCSL